jgi:hypothetical protein
MSERAAYILFKVALFLGGAMLLVIAVAAAAGIVIPIVLIVDALIR